ncbi:MAG: GNAT family N-acetyltransferase [Magnetococcales bacterium]|nr:GNAT family N-acetyltransferase [Magnetococcales bacterium]
MLTGKHTGLRAIERDDLKPLLNWRNKPKFRRYFREYRELSMAQQERWFEKVVLGDPNTRMFAIVSLADNQLLGAAGLCYIDGINRNADLSIYIGHDDLYIDDHYALDAARVLLKYGFEELSLHRIWAEIYSIDNDKKCFFDHLGFTLEGTHRQTHWTEGGWTDSLFYGLLAPEFNNQPEPR